MEPAIQALQVDAPGSRSESWVGVCGMGVLDFDLSSLTGSAPHLRLQIDELNGIRATGDSISPSLSVGFSFQEVDSDAIRPFRHGLLAIGAQLFQFRPGNEILISQTGLQFPYGMLSLPLHHGQIEALTVDGEKQSPPSMRVRLRYMVLVDTQRLKPAPGYSDLPPLIPYYTQSAVDIAVPQARWLGFLRTWGYPETRLVPVSAQLPGAIETKNAVAAKAWSAACGALETATKAWREGNSSKAGDELRIAVNQAMYTWASIWGNDGPATKDSASLAIGHITKSIPGCDPDNGQWPKDRADVDAQRLCAHWGMLRQLVRVAQPPHHDGLHSIYTREDVEHALLATVAALRALPTIFAAFPNPPLRAAPPSP